MPKVVACFHCQDHLLERFGGKKLINSWKYFHPDIPIIWYNDSKQAEIKRKYPGFDFLSFNAPIIYETKREYKADLVVFIDCDSIVLGALDEILNLDYDVASVKNDPDCHTENEDRNRPIKGVPNQMWVNAGFVAISSDKFLEDWIELNRDAIENKGGIRYYKMVEQDTLNILFHSKKYKTRILDENSANLFCGPSANYNSGNKYCAESIKKEYGGIFYNWGSWYDIEYKNNEFWLNNKICKVIHKAGGGKYENNEKLHWDLFNNDTVKVLKQITNEHS